MSKRLKGTMTLVLTDAASGEVVESLTEENMITNAANEILGTNPMGIFYNTFTEYPGFIWNDNLLPICPNMIGGLLLFPKTLTEDAANIYPASDNLPGAYASNNVNSTANAARGSLNLMESKALDNGYRFVWEFTPSQGNGAIAAAALTSAKGGLNVYGSSAGDNTPFLEIGKLDLGNVSLAKQLPLFQAVEIDFENEIIYSISFDTSSAIVKKMRFPIFSVGLNERLNGADYTVLEETALVCSTFKFLGSYTLYGDFLDGHDGYWYGFSNEGNSSGSAAMLWIKIKKSDYSFTEGSWTLANAKLQPIGSFGADNYPERKTRGVIRNGYLYLPAYNKKGIYKINLSNPTDVTLIEFGFTSGLKPLGGSGSSENYLVIVGDLIIGSDFQVTVSDEVIKTSGSTRFEEIGTPLFQYREFLFAWASSYGNEYMMCYMLTPYMASINNLSSAVIKTTEMTMKITYELTEETAA